MSSKEELPILKYIAKNTPHESGLESIMPHVSHRLLKFLNKTNIKTLKNTSRRINHNLKEFDCDEKMGEMIQGSIKDWRRKHPAAKCANISGKILKGDDLKFLGPIILRMPNGEEIKLPSIKEINMSHCKNVNDDDFKYLKGVRKLNMSYCLEITDAAFEYLKGIHTLDMSFCRQKTITDNAFNYLKGIKSLTMVRCDQITDEAFNNLKRNDMLRGIEKLDISRCKQITPGVITMLLGSKHTLKTFNIRECNDDTITEATRLFGVTSTNTTVKVRDNPLMSRGGRNRTRRN